MLGALLHKGLCISRCGATAQKARLRASLPHSSRPGFAPATALLRMVRRRAEVRL
jgi:hypothetical protein